MPKKTDVLHTDTAWLSNSFETELPCRQLELVGLVPTSVETRYRNHLRRSETTRADVLMGRAFFFLRAAAGMVHRRLPERDVELEAFAAAAAELHRGIVRWRETVRATLAEQAGAGPVTDVAIDAATCVDLEEDPEFDTEREQPVQLNAFDENETGGRGFPW